MGMRMPGSCWAPPMVPPCAHWQSRCLHSYSPSSFFLHVSFACWIKYQPHVGRQENTTSIPLLPCPPLRSPPLHPFLDCSSFMSWYSGAQYFAAQQPFHGCKFWVAMAGHEAALMKRGSGALWMQQMWHTTTHKAAECINYIQRHTHQQWFAYALAYWIMSSRQNSRTKQPQCHASIV